MDSVYYYWNTTVESVHFRDLFSEVAPDFTKYSGATLQTGYFQFLVLLFLSYHVILLCKVGVSQRFRNRSNWEMFMEVKIFRSESFIAV